MKRYWLFAIANHYSKGGLDDLEGTFDTWEECLLYIREKAYGIDDEWCRDKDDYEFEIFDSEKHIRYHLDDNESILYNSEYRVSWGFVTVKLKKEIGNE